MHLETIDVQHFRNYEHTSIDLSESINVFIGENAQGKTNLLEAIFVLAMAKSHRTPHVKELIQWGQEYAKIEGRVNKKNGIIPLELTISHKGKKAKANHIERKKLSQYVGLCNVVLFAPEDLRLVKDSPSHRRRFIDMEIGQIQPVYMHELSEFQKLLQQRNALLKKLSREAKPSTTMLEILTEQLIELAADIVYRRFRFIRLLREWARPIHQSISNGQEALDIHYVSSVNEVSEGLELSRIKREYEKAFESSQRRELDRGTTLIGPHRDDLQFIVNDKNIQIFGSQGQQRTTALSLKLAEIELIHNEVGEYPILLLDDVLSELDDQRQTHLLSTFKERVQTIVTTTNVGAIDHDMIKHARSFDVHKGQIGLENK
ncbi:DNA replication and repair protein RecF [Pullulanibacillus camelliae]|uniref:DNA replication and repair protein RecF n=1 Tax=Pullulanibacillus camelliae TaxID=1707096 RepID=A0A8J2YKJ1_9BACL|nr:DNA replication/repair protein RecF [Pullulanibacillus camelliae]GGE48145.1 DNA replication and repair protein RecF [Pullulanibacillus camelliae]